MKKIITILTILFFANNCFAQLYPTPYLGIGGTSTNIGSSLNGGTFVLGSFVFRVFTDTNAANAVAYVAKYPASTIFCTSDSSEYIWYGRWLKQAYTGAQNPVTTIYSGNGNIPTTRDINMLENTIIWDSVSAAEWAGMQGVAFPMVGFHQTSPAAVYMQYNNPAGVNSIFSVQSDTNNNETNLVVNSPLNANGVFSINTSRSGGNTIQSAELSAGNTQDSAIVRDAAGFWHLLPLDSIGGGGSVQNIYTVDGQLQGNRELSGQNLYSLNIDSVVGFNIQTENGAGAEFNSSGFFLFDEFGNTIHPRSGGFVMTSASGYNIVDNGDFNLLTTGFGLATIADDTTEIQTLAGDEVVLTSDLFLATLNTGDNTALTTNGWNVTLGDGGGLYYGAGETSNGNFTIAEENGVSASIWLYNPNGTLQGFKGNNSESEFGAVWILPATDGSAGQVLTTKGPGAGGDSLYWSTMGGGGGSDTTIYTASSNLISPRDVNGQSLYSLSFLGLTGDTTDAPIILLGSLSNNSALLSMTNSSGDLNFYSDDPYFDINGTSRHFRMGDYTGDWYYTYVDVNDSSGVQGILLHANNGVTVSNLAGNGVGVVGVDNNGLLSWASAGGYWTLTGTNLSNNVGSELYFNVHNTNPFVGQNIDSLGEVFNYSNDGTNTNLITAHYADGSYSDYALYNGVFNLGDSSSNQGAKTFNITNISGTTTALSIDTSANTHFGAGAILKGYTVATLPAGIEGEMVYVTDALVLTYGATVTGGGSVVTPVFWNGSNWIIH